MDLIVGTFNTPHLYTLRFTLPSPSHSQNNNTTTTPQGTLQITARHPAIGSHSWLALSPRKTHLYATAWTDPPSIAAYRLDYPTSSTAPSSASDGSASASSAPVPKLLNTQPVASRSGYCCASSTHVYSAGGPSGEVFPLNPDGSLGACVQSLSFLDDAGTDSGKEERPHGDFGGLRHGAHSIDLSPDGRNAYVADIGRNCVWCYSVASLTEGSAGKVGDKGGSQAKPLTYGSKCLAPRAGDGPRHATPHPNGKTLYVVQEHSSIVDIYAVADDGVTLTHQNGVQILPTDKDAADFWADEVRVSALGDGVPRYLYASTRGLRGEVKGYVGVWSLDEGGEVVGEGGVLDLWETPTSGGIANAVEPAPVGDGDGEVEYLALTDSEEGWVFVLGFDGRRVSEVARCKLEHDVVGEVVAAATALWL